MIRALIRSRRNNDEKNRARGNGTGGVTSKANRGGYYVCPFNAVRGENAFVCERPTNRFDISDDSDIVYRGVLYGLSVGGQSA
jgi:hypothetical protein